MRPALVVRRAAEYLSRHDVPDPLPTAEALLANVLGTDRTGLYAREEGLSSSQARRFGRALCRRCVGEPLQHVTGEQAFRRLVVEVRPGVFIPRPETEIVVERALAIIAEVSAPLVVDVCTGTGAVALAIADERPDARVIASDLSPEAVALATTNAERLGLAVHVLRGDLLEPLGADVRGRVDLVVGNPPYVAAEAATSLPLDVLAEPPLALFGDVGIYVRLFSQARGILRPGGAIVVEIEESRGTEVATAASDAGFRRVEVSPDLAGRDRVVAARSPG